MPDKSPAEVLADELNKTGEEEVETTSATESSDAIAAASEEASQAASAETEEPSSQEEEQRPTGRSPKLQKILDKYNGDEELAAESIFESWNSVSKIKREFEEFKNQMLEQKNTQAAEPDPDVQGLQGEIATLDDELKANEGERRSLLSEVDATKTEVAVLEGQLRLADEFQKPQLEQRKMLAERELKGLLRQWQGLNKQDIRINREKSSLARQLRASESRLKDLQSQRHNQQIESQAVQRDIFRDFVGEVADLASKHGVEDESVIEHMISTLRSEAHLYLSNIPDNAPGIDIPAFVQARGQAYLKALGVLKTKNFSAQSALKGALVRPGVTPKGSQVPPANGKAPKQFAPRSAQEAKAWAAAKLAELSRAGAS